MYRGQGVSSLKSWLSSVLTPAKWKKLGNGHLLAQLVASTPIGYFGCLFVCCFFFWWQSLIIIIKEQSICEQDGVGSTILQHEISQHGKVQPAPVAAKDCSCQLKKATTYGSLIIRYLSIRSLGFPSRELDHVFFVYV